MSERPQAVREEQEDLLERIFTQGLEKRKAPAKAEAAPEPARPEQPPAPEQKGGGNAVLPAERKNRRSSVYLYLLVLFGAAFLMLLLAYFVQRRSSESAINDLDLSRDELLDEISALEEQNAALGRELDRLSGELSQWRERYEEKNGEATGLLTQNYDAQKGLYAWTSFWELERHYQAGDYESCAAVLILQEQGQYTYQTPESAQERYDEILRTVLDAGILEEDYYRYPDSYNDLLDAYFSKVSRETER